MSRRHRHDFSAPAVPDASSRKRGRSETADQPPAHHEQVRQTVERLAGQFSDTIPAAGPARDELLLKLCAACDRAAGVAVPAVGAALPEGAAVDEMALMSDIIDIIPDDTAGATLVCELQAFLRPFPVPPVAAADAEAPAPPRAVSVTPPVRVAAPSEVDAAAVDDALGAVLGGGLLAAPPAKSLTSAARCGATPVLPPPTAPVGAPIRIPLPAAPDVAAGTLAPPILNTPAAIVIHPAPFSVSPANNAVFPAPGFVPYPHQWAGVPHAPMLPPPQHHAGRGRPPLARDVVLEGLPAALCEEPLLQDLVRHHCGPRDYSAVSWLFIFRLPVPEGAAAPAPGAGGPPRRPTGRVFLHLQNARDGAALIVAGPQLVASHPGARASAAKPEDVTAARRGVAAAIGRSEAAVLAAIERATPKTAVLLAADRRLAAAQATLKCIKAAQAASVRRAASPEGAVSDFSKERLLAALQAVAAATQEAVAAKAAAQADAGEALSFRSSSAPLYDQHAVVYWRGLPAPLPDRAVLAALEELRVQPQRVWRDPSSNTLCVEAANATEVSAVLCWLYPVGGWFLDGCLTRSKDGPLASKPAVNEPAAAVPAVPPGGLSLPASVLAATATGATPPAAADNAEPAATTSQAHDPDGNGTAAAAVRSHTTDAAAAVAVDTPAAATHSVEVQGAAEPMATAADSQ